MRTLAAAACSIVTLAAGQIIAAQERSTRLLSWPRPLSSLAAVRGGFVAADDSGLVWWSHGYVAHRKVEGRVSDLKLITMPRADVVVAACSGHRGPFVLAIDQWGGAGRRIWQGAPGEHIMSLAVSNAGRGVVGIAVRVLEPEDPVLRLSTPSSDYIVNRVLGDGEGPAETAPMGRD